MPSACRPWTTSRPSSAAWPSSSGKVTRDGAGDGWIPAARSPLGARKTWRLVAAGKVAASRVGRRLYVLADEVDAFLAARPAKAIRATRAEPVTTAADAKGYAETRAHLLAASGHGGE